MLLRQHDELPRDAVAVRAVCLALEVILPRLWRDKAHKRILPFGDLPAVEMQLREK